MYRRKRCSDCDGFRNPPVYTRYFGDDFYLASPARRDYGVVRARVHHVCAASPTLYRRRLLKLAYRTDKDHGEIYAYREMRTELSWALQLMYVYGPDEDERFRKYADILSQERSRWFPASGPVRRRNIRTTLKTSVSPSECILEDVLRVNAGDAHRGGKVGDRTSDMRESGFACYELGIEHLPQTELTFRGVSFGRCERAGRRE